MESTGVYWIPLFEILEQRGFTVKLVDARKTKNVSGRKSDVLDCQWLQTLHTYGLLEGAFRPVDEVCVLRGYVRQKEMLVQAASMHIQHMQKALQQMNLLLHNVVSDITGFTGMSIIKAIIAGERDPKVLAKHRDHRCRNSVRVIAKSLVGNYREEHLFALTQAVELYETFRPRSMTASRQSHGSWALGQCRRRMNHRHRQKVFLLCVVFEPISTCAPDSSSSPEWTSLVFPVLEPIHCSPFLLKLALT